MKVFTPTIGLEVHVELSTKSKMFCGCMNDPHGSAPNTNICPVCLAHPGTLPTINKEAVKNIVLVGTAVSGTIATYSEFDRKNYFYPDIPKAYQISQYQFPFVTGGELAGVSITRVHLEEDTARSLHDQVEGSIVDFNRAGVPLMELVTEPVIHDAKTAGNFARELQLLLRTLKVSEANMERGEMRIEANISVSDTDRLGTKVEVKNLNSFKSVEAAIIYEVNRQTEELTNGREIVPETRGWNEQKQVTFTQRRKETAHDYRYFPDPDIPKIDLTISFSRIKENLPELPAETRTSLADAGVAAEAIELMLANPELLSFYKTTAEALSDDPKEKKLAANYLTSDIWGLMQNESTHVLLRENAALFATLVGMVGKGTITSRVAKDLLVEVVFEGKDPLRLSDERGLTQNSSEDDLLPIIDAIIKEHGGVVLEYRQGKEAALQFLIGQGMKATRGAGNPAMLKDLFVKQIGK